MLLVPGTSGYMQVLHHGFAHAGDLGEESVILVVNGNLSEPAIKVLSKHSTVGQF